MKKAALLQAEKDAPKCIHKSKPRRRAAFFDK